MDKYIGKGKSLGYCLPDFLESESSGINPIRRKILKRMVAKRKRIRENFALLQVEKRLRGVK